MVQELVVLIDVLQFHLVYQRLILSHSTERNVVVFRHLYLKVVDGYMHV